MIDWKALVTSIPQFAIPLNKCGGKRIRGFTTIRLDLPKGDIFPTSGRPLQLNYWIWLRSKLEKRQDF